MGEVRAAMKTAGGWVRETVVRSESKEKGSVL
jgi:hypothetical protein